jgi:hypothetical protein
MDTLDEIVRDVLLGFKLNHLDDGYFKKRYGFSLDVFCSNAIKQLLNTGYIGKITGKLHLTQESIFQCNCKYLTQALLKRYAM